MPTICSPVRACLIRSWRAQAGATAKFDETVELAINLGTDPRRGDHMVRGVASLPHGTGKTVRVAVFAQGDAAEAARAAGTLLKDLSHYILVRYRTSLSLLWASHAVRRAVWPWILRLAPSHSK